MPAMIFSRLPETKRESTTYPLLVRTTKNEKPLLQWMYTVCKRFFAYPYPQTIKFKRP